MDEWVWMLLGVLAAGPLWLTGARLVTRRRRREAREKISRDAANHDHLLEVSRLVGGLAHEIKNPLSTMTLNLKLLLEDLDDPRDERQLRWRRRIAGVEDEARRLKEILDDFLRYAGKIEIHRQPTDLVGLVDEVVDFFAPQAEASRVVMRTSLPPQPVRCDVDGHLIKQALLNLLINAVDAMPSGGELLVRLTPQERSAVIEVIDTGEGIPPQLQERVFEIYFTTKKGGSGIGLPMTRRLIREHGGTIRLESEPGKGTRFIINLPQICEP